MKTIIWKDVDAEQQKQLLKRPVSDNKKTVEAVVQNIINEVKSSDDEALIHFTEQYDKVKLDSITVTNDELTNAVKDVKPEDLAAIKLAISRIENYQRQMLPNTITVDTNDGVVCRSIPRAIEKVGLYVPGGTAPLVSTLIMLAVPAKIASCPIRVICTPPDKNGEINPLILVTAQLCGIETIYKLGGVQAIAAMAYGTDTVTKVDKIYGPGNAWVTAAKVVVSQDPEGAAIDMPAGPSEVLVIADQNANPQYIAADLLSQAEHGVDSQVILVTTSSEQAKKVNHALEKQLPHLSRQDIARQSLEKSLIIITESLEEAFVINNQYGPEHLILQIDTADSYIDEIKNAGAIFIGPWTPETMGDYLNGSNHVLPTYGHAKTFSSLSVRDFMRTISIQKVSKAGLEKLGPSAMRLASIEGLTAHENAIKIRLTSGD
jgi:histidinol dehydrogenase